MGVGHWPLGIVLVGGHLWQRFEEKGQERARSCCVWTIEDESNKNVIYTLYQTKKAGSASKLAETQRLDEFLAPKARQESLAMLVSPQCAASETEMRLLC